MSAEPPDHGRYQPLDPCRAAVPARPLCAASAIDPPRPLRHRVGVDPYVITHGPHRYLICSKSCLVLLVRTWRPRRPAS